MDAHPNLKAPLAIPITLGHAIFVWEVLSSHFGDPANIPALTANERKAIWGLTDLIEQSLAENGITGELDNYQALLKDAEQHLQNDITVMFVD